MAINLVWSGPYTYGQVLDLDGGADYGVYQIYCHHPVYGAGALVYIGKADRATFGARFGNADYAWLGDDARWEDNGRGIRIHVGRIHLLEKEAPPTAAAWSRWITLLSVS